MALTIRITTVKHSLLRKLLQNTILVRESFHPLLHPACSLHPSQEYRVALVKILALVVVPVVQGAINLLHQQARRAVRREMVTGGQARVRMICSGHVRDGTLLKIFTDKVVVAFITRHGGSMTISHSVDSLLVDLGPRPPIGLRSPRDRTHRTPINP